MKYQHQNFSAGLNWTAQISNEVQYHISCHPNPKYTEQTFAVFYKETFVDGHLTIYGHYYGFEGGGYDRQHDFKCIFNADLSKIVHFYVSDNFKVVPFGADLAIEDNDQPFKDIELSDFDIQQLRMVNDLWKTWLRFPTDEEEERYGECTYMICEGHESEYRKASRRDCVAVSKNIDYDLLAVLSLHWSIGKKFYKYWDKDPEIQSDPIPTHYQSVRSKRHE